MNSSFNHSVPHHNKAFTCFFVLLMILGTLQSQTFTNNTVAVANSWNASLVRTVNVSGLTAPLGSGNQELMQINLHMGRQADGTYNYSRYTVTVQSPSGTTITLISGNPNPTSFPNSSVREFDIKFRDNQYLQLPISGSGSLCEPWNIGYYRTYTANDFSAFNGEDPNGNWTVTIAENSVSSGARFNKVDLVFGTLSVTDYTLFTGNDNCATPFCLRPSEIVIGTNNGFTNQGDDMYNPNTSGCAWNAAQNNSAWYKFIAESSNVEITISGITGNLQILAVETSGINPCVSGSNTVVSGGCPYGLPNDSYISPRYSNGSINNNQLQMTGLTPGQTYYFIVDGNGGSISPFYIEISTGAKDSCDDILPVEMLYFFGTGFDNAKELKWGTASEINNDYFIVECAAENSDFETVGFVRGNGTTNELSEYRFIHHMTEQSGMYYRLKQVDYDGNFAYSDIIYVGSSSENLQPIIAFDSEVHSVYIATGEDVFEVTILGIAGNVIYHGRNQRDISLPSINPGVYVVCVKTNSYQHTQKFVVY